MSFVERVYQYQSISDFNQNEWNSLAINAGPFLQYEFLAALEQSGSVDNSDVNDTGWTPRHLAVRDEHQQLVGAVPGYIKTHSYGEYVFDHSWANAYHQHGLDYYPKWIAAIPFTPVTGSRILTQPESRHAVLPALLEAAKNMDDVSSEHWLFNSVIDQQTLMSSGRLPRYSVQFQWQNQEFAHFDDFLGCFKSRKRKDIKKERRKAQQGLTISRLSGDQITDYARHVFYLCYQHTYLKRSGHNGYLTEAFFRQVFSTMKDNILLVIASDNDQPVAASLFFYDHTGLYGRYWGALKEVDGLHFECCYYQGIEFAIEHKLPIFNPGTQGEHKLLRGFEPLVCASAHSLRDDRFHHAVADYLGREAPAIAQYFEHAQLSLPFNQDTREHKVASDLTHKIHR